MVLLGYYIYANDSIVQKTAEIITHKGKNSI